MTTTPTSQANTKNGQPPLDTTRPFMDDSQASFIETKGKAEETRGEVKSSVGVESVQELHERVDEMLLAMS